jgi:hypothetical protein
MEKIFDKISSYNLFNNLLPGAIYAIFVKSIGEIQLINDNILINLFVFYFLGVIIGRIGSVVVEELAKKWGIVKYADYSDFIVASDKDKKLEVLLEVNNMYRTFIALFLSITLTTIYKYFLQKICFINEYNLYIIFIVLLVLFIFSFRKQTKYIYDRVQNSCNMAP